MEQEIAIYRTKDGQIELNVNISSDTIWLSQQQMSELFGIQRQAITKHLKNIFESGELEENSVSSKMEHTASDGKKYRIKVYNLDSVISVGYRVNSVQATKFRIWATNILKKHLIDGYSLNKKTLQAKGVNEIQEAIDLLEKTLTNNELISDIGKEAIRLIHRYSKSWSILLSYDQETLQFPASGSPSKVFMDYSKIKHAIEEFKKELIKKKEASTLFGNEIEGRFCNLLGNIEQTFDRNPLYKTVEEKASNLFYFIIKDHPFSDGNKRIACLVFLLYLKQQNLDISLGESGLVALALCVAESKPSQKDLIIRLIANLLETNKKSK